MTNDEKFVEVFGTDLKRQYSTKSWWEQEFVPARLVEVNEMKDYTSPIEKITNNIIKTNEEQLEDSMLFSVEREIGFKVDKEELIKALKYDRKQYEKGFKDGLKSVLDKIKDEFISLYPKNYAGEPELGGCSCLFSLNQILRIIDKFKQIRYCDRCGEECEFMRDTLGYKLQKDHTEIDLCQRCYNSLNRWLKENEKASPTGAEDDKIRIRAELHSTAEMHQDDSYYVVPEWIDEVFDKYKAKEVKE